MVANITMVPMIPKMPNTANTMLRMPNTVTEVGRCIEFGGSSCLTLRLEKEFRDSMAKGRLDLPAIILQLQTVLPGLLESRGPSPRNSNQFKTSSVMKEI